jgi:hypothetical protein
LEAREMASAKSPGLLRYEREAALLVEQYCADKIDFKQFSSSMMAALRRGADAMTEMELREAERSLMVMLNDATDIPAKLGHPLPGDNPDRPN